MTLEDLPEGSHAHEQAAIVEHTLTSLRRQELSFHLSWSLFPIGLFLAVTHVVPMAAAEGLLIVAELYAKVLFASTALATNYMAVDAELQLVRLFEVENLVRKEAFISRVSHELRTPLNGIIGSVGAARARPKQRSGLMALLPPCFAAD